MQTSQLQFYYDFSIASKFGIVLTLVSEDKIGSDGKAYKKWGVLLKFLPSDPNQQMKYDTDRAFTMKTSIENLAAFSGALLAAYKGEPVKFSIFTDSSKSVVSSQQEVMKVFTITNIDPKTQKVNPDKIYVGAYKSDKTTGIKDGDGMYIDRFTAYGWHKVLEKFLDVVIYSIVQKSIV